MPSLLACLGCGGKGESDDIKTLDYTHASLTDVPSDVFACERTLEELYLDSNQLSELPRQLFYCHGLKTLGLSDNELTSLPPAVASLINLASIDLSKNAISDIPDNIKGCKQLSAVDASINPLCRLPEGFTQLLSLQELYLNDTFLEYLPANFGRLSRLRILELRENQLNTLPKSIARLTTLQRLDIGQNDFSELPEVIGSLVNLTELWFDNNKVKSVPPLVGHLKKLTHLDACKNKVDWVAGEVENCIALTDFHLSSNNLKELPEQLGSCRALETLKVDDNALTRLPATLGGLVSLRELVASQNDLEELPASVGLLRALHTLHLDDNLLTYLPGELGSCCNLRVLTAASNRLTSVPGELGHLPCLAVLNLCDNLLPHLPVSLTKLKLRALWLSENQNKPKVQLQSEVQPSTGQRVLTCFMLPQQPRPHHPEAVEEDNFPGAGWEEQRRARTLIKFAFEGDVDKPGGRLSRAPTPYPKELKALARHARNLSALQKDPQHNQFVQQKDPTRQMAPVRGVAEQNSSVGGQAGMTSQAGMKESADDTDKVPQRPGVVSDDEGEGGVITSPLPVLAPQAEERPLLREARNVRNNSSTLNSQASDANKTLAELDASRTPGADRPYAIGDRKVFGLAQVVSTARTPGENDTPPPPPEHVPLLARSPTSHYSTEKDMRPNTYNRMEGDREESIRNRQQDDDDKQQESALIVKEVPGTQQSVGTTATAVTSTEDENNDTSSSSDSGYGNGKTSQQQSVDEPQISEGNSTTPSSPLHLTTDPSLSLPSTPSSPPAHISHPTSPATPSTLPTSLSTSFSTQASPFPSSTLSVPFSNSSHFPTAMSPNQASVSPARPLSLAPHQRLSHLAAPPTSRPASIATGSQLEAAGGGRVNRPGSLALGALADSALLTRVPQEQRPGSLAAPINTVGIPPAPTRAASHMALNTTSPSSRLHQHHHQHPMFRSQDLSHSGRGLGHTTTTTTTPRQESNGLVSIIDQVTSSLLEHDDSPPPKTTNTSIDNGPEPPHHHHQHQQQQQTTVGPQYLSGQDRGRTGDRDAADSSSSSAGPANFTQDQPRGEVLHPTPHRPAGLFPNHPQTTEGPPGPLTDTQENTENSTGHKNSETTETHPVCLSKDSESREVTSVSKITNQADTPTTQKVSKLPSRIPSVSPDYVGPPAATRLTQQHQHHSSQQKSPYTPHDPHAPQGQDPNKAAHTPRTPTSTTTLDPRRISDTRIPTLSPGTTTGPERTVGGESRIPTLAAGVSRGPGCDHTNDHRANWEPHRPAGSHTSPYNPGESSIPIPGRSLSNLSQESISRKLNGSTPNDTRPQRPAGVAAGGAGGGGRVFYNPRTPTTPTSATMSPGPHTPTTATTPTPHHTGPATPRQQQLGGYGYGASRAHHATTPVDPTSPSQTTSRIQSPLGYSSGIRPPSLVSPSQQHTPPPLNTHQHTPTPPSYIPTHTHQQQTPPPPSHIPTHAHHTPSHANHQQQTPPSSIPVHAQARPMYSGIRVPGVVNSAINTPGIPLPTSQSPNVSTQLMSPGSRASVTSTGSASRIPHIAGGVPSRLPGTGGSRHRVAPTTSSQAPQTTPPGPQTPDGSGGGVGGSRSGWMFGQHKNVRVFPVVIEKNPDLGFTIGQSPSDPDDKSVYVTSVAGGGAASSALKVGDKLLQVDGADLRTATLPTAAAALANTTSTVNLMVSRLQ